MNEQLQLEAQQMGMTVDEYVAYLASQAEMLQSVRDLTKAVKHLAGTVAMHAAQSQLQINSAEWRRAC